ncbi:MAG TPA: hypothetical protein VJ723_05325 [Candidatus Angelobacter sp.]|nr:hypothetical protein [Candidatus Angelobacter sp.]
MSKTFATTFSYASLACSLLFWAEMVLNSLEVAPHWQLRQLTAWSWLGISASGVVLGIVGAVRGSKLSVLAIPLALITFLFVFIVSAG